MDLAAPHVGREQQKNTPQNMRAGYGYNYPVSRVFLLSFSCMSCLRSPLRCLSVAKSRAGEKHLLAGLCYNALNNVQNVQCLVLGTTVN